LNFDVSLCIQIENKFQFEEEGIWDYNFCGILDPAAVPECTKFSSLPNVLLQLVRDIINGVCYQRYGKRLEQQQKGRPNINVCAAEENLEKKLKLHQYSIIVYNQISALICFCS